MLKKTTLKLAFSLFGVAMAGSLIALIILFAFASLIDKSWGNVLFSGLNLLILWSLIYSTSWHEGFKDPNRVKYGHMDKFMIKGLIAGLITSIPFLIAYILYATALGENWQLITRLIYDAFYLSYLPIMNAIYYPAKMWILLLPLPLFASLGYIMGYWQISITSKLVYKNKKTMANIKK